MRVISVALGIVVAAVGLKGCARPRRAGDARSGAETRKTISQIGSTTVLPLAQRWREVFNEERPDIDIALSGGGSGTGIKALIDGTADIANSSREIKPKELEQAKAAGVSPLEHIVARDGIAVIVHPSNPLRVVSVEQVSEIYSGAITEWGEVGARGLGQIQVVSRDSASGTYEAFKDLVITLCGAEESRDYAAAVLKQGSNQAILALVGQTKTAIGYVGLGYLDDSVKPLKLVSMGAVEPVAPTAVNVMSGAYPVSRALYCYTDGEPTGVVGEYLDWVQGPGGQALVEELGFVPVGE